ncbi:MAG: hypothetical protein GY906_37255 [bacterium]|nr:hypothetical protein [bacterium]
MSLYGRSHYEDFARIIAKWEAGEENGSWKTMRDHIRELFAKDNPAFNEERFNAKIEQHFDEFFKARSKRRKLP